MKKSRKLSLVLMGSLLLSSCTSSQAEEQQVFKDKAECVASGKFNEEQCAKMEADAQAEAPKFATREECVKQFGENMCVQGNNNSSGGSFFMPLLMGFMAGKLLGGGSAMPGQGLFSSPSGTGYQTAKGAPVAVPPTFGDTSSGTRTTPAASSTTTNRSATQPASDTTPSRVATPRSRPSPLGSAVSRGGFSTGTGSVGA